MRVEQAGSLSIQRDTIRGLQAGLGSEDIAARHGYRLCDVQAVMGDLRARKLLRGFLCRSWRGAAARLSVAAMMEDNR